MPGTTSPTSVMAEVFDLGGRRVGPSDTFVPMDEVRQRVLDATARCVLRYSLQRTTVDDISKESGVSRASIYRHFPGGRDDILSSTVAYQVDNFYASLASELSSLDRFEDVLVVGLMSATRLLDEHELFQRVMAVEPEIVLPWVTVESDRILRLISDLMRSHVGGERNLMPDQLDIECDHVARLFLSCMEAPGSWNMSNEVEVRELVRTQFLVL